MTEVSATLTLDGSPILLVLDNGGRIALTPEQADALADDLTTMADEARGWSAP